MRRWMAGLLMGAFLLCGSAQAEDVKLKSGAVTLLGNAYIVDNKPRVRLSMESGGTTYTTDINMSEWRRFLNFYGRATQILRPTYLYERHEIGQVGGLHVTWDSNPVYRPAVRNPIPGSYPFLGGIVIRLGDKEFYVGPNDRIAMSAFIDDVYRQMK